MRFRIGTAIACTSLAVGTQAQGATASCPNPKFQQQAQAAIQTFRHENDISGAVVVGINGQAVLRQAIGLASRELRVPNTPLTKFRIGSITKQFTAAAILQLQEAGKLSLDDPLSKFYTDAPPTWSQITLRHLLTHTAGLFDYTYLVTFFGPKSRQPQTPETLIKLFRDRPLLAEPGKGFVYNNSDYLLLGYVIEKASGEPYADYLQHHIFQPLGMTHSGFDSSKAIIPDRALGYERDLGTGGWLNGESINPDMGYAAGALYSTVDDLLVWDQALSTGRLLKPESVKAMFTNYGHKYGYGWYVDQMWGQDRIWHPGDINGFTAQNVLYPQSHLAVAVLFNEHILSEKLATDLAGLCLGKQVYPPEVRQTRADLERYAGYYSRNEVQTLKIDPRDGVLATGNFQQGDTHLYPRGDGRFFGKTFAVDVEFQSAPDGNVTGLLLSPPGLAQPLAYKRIDPAEGERILSIPLSQRMAAAAKAAAEAAAARQPAPARP